MRRPAASKRVDEMFPNASVVLTRRLEASYPRLERLPRGSTLATYRPPASYTADPYSRGRSVMPTQRPAASNPKLVRFPSGSTLAINWLLVSNTAVAVLPSGFVVLTGAARRVVRQNWWQPRVGLTTRHHPARRVELRDETLPSGSTLATIRFPRRKPPSRRSPIGFVVLAQRLSRVVAETGSVAQRINVSRPAANQIVNTVLPYGRAGLSSSRPGWRRRTRC